MVALYCWFGTMSLYSPLGITIVGEYLEVPGKKRNGKPKIEIKMIVSCDGTTGFDDFK